MVYNSNGRKENSPEIFGKKQYHPGSHSSNSLTSQIVKKRLNETGQLNKLQKLQSLQSAASDYGKPTFYSEDSEARTKNAAISSNTRPVLEVAKLFLGDGATSGADINNNSRFTKFQDIKQLLHTKANGDTETRNNFRVNDIKVETDYAQDYRQSSQRDLSEFKGRSLEGSMLKVGRGFCMDLYCLYRRDMPSLHDTASNQRYNSTLLIDSAQHNRGHIPTKQSIGFFGYLQLHAS